MKYITSNQRVIRHLNQHAVIVRKKYIRTRSWLATITMLGILGYFFVQGFIAYNHLDFQFTVDAPTVKKAYAAPKPTPTPEVVITPEQTQIDDYIREVFGEDSDKAFLLLTCENSAHDPEAVNTAGNYPVGSRDIGVFMVNEYWQATQGKFLFNWKINVQVAKQLFDENGGSFHLWTCGRKLGI